MERQAVSSSSVVSIGYDGASQVLEVEFANGGIYQYLDVPAWCFEELTRSDSVGTFVNAQVKPHYRYVRQ
ncbi:KTSC domain-containing protein [Terrabacter sp. GCM10028922]|uniref:KTSC domain-containing protein n=1 Tax=Terrabacter sp. GCM10028922 TaxID=3273428 RepID=UPI00360752FD